MSDYEAEQAGGISEAPDETFEDYEDPNTGETEKVPTGVQPGFAYNPGMS